MNAHELGKKYDQISEWWNAEIARINPGIGYVNRGMEFIAENSRILDIGCGSGRMIELFRKNHQVTGIDVSNEMIKMAKAKHPGIEFICEDFFEWNTRETFDYIIAWDSLFHAPYDLQKPLTVKMCDLLSEGGILLFTAGGVDGEVSGSMKGVSFEYASLDYKECLYILEEKNCKVILLERDQYPQEHMVFICQKVGS